MNEEMKGKVLGESKGAKPEQAAEVPPKAVPEHTMNASQIADVVTGATRGMVDACRELNLGNPGDVAQSLGIKPPGMA